MYLSHMWKLLITDIAFATIRQVAVYSVPSNTLRDAQNLHKKDVHHTTLIQCTS